MAAADLKAELECSVCLDIYTDPVMLQCGHNFCRVCIDRVLDTQKSGGYSCPECRQRFHQRPAPSRNMKLRNIIENFLPTQTPEREEPGVSCSYCGDPPRLVCLHCDISLCDKHRSVHENSQEHVFTERKSRKCSIHSKQLEYYCTEHETCVCVSCCIVGEHAGHKMESLEEAAARTKNKMNKALQKLLTKTENMEERVQNLQESKNEVEEKEADDTDRVTAMFMDIRRQLEVLEKEVLRDISGQSKRVTLSMMDLIQELEKKKDELSRKIRHIEMLCNVTDSLTVLQETSMGDLCGTEDGDNEDRQRDNKLLGDGRDLNTAGILHNLHITLSNIMCDVKRKKLTSQQVHPHIGTKGTGDISAPSHVESQSSSTLKGTYQPDINIMGPSNNTDIILNINTAGNDLWISDNRKSVSSSVFTHKYPETPGRFQSAQVLSDQSLSSGHHYWEVDVERSKVWTVGMCYPSIDRRGCHSEIGWNSKSWGLHKSWLKNQYSVLFNRKWIRLPDRVTSNKVRICLDYEAGQISFYDLCVPIRHLHTFNATFTEPLCAILWVGEGCVKICKRDQECNDLLLGMSEILRDTNGIS